MSEVGLSHKFLMPLTRFNGNDVHSSIVMIGSLLTAQVVALRVKKSSAVEGNKPKTGTGFYDRLIVSIALSS